jgi:hypothetical protein
VPLNRFYLTQDGWAPEGALKEEAESWAEMIRRDVLDNAWRAHDETAVSPPLAVMVDGTSPTSSTGAMAGIPPAMAYGVFNYLPRSFKDEVQDPS